MEYNGLQELFQLQLKYFGSRVLLDFGLDHILYDTDNYYTKNCRNMSNYVENKYFFDSFFIKYKFLNKCTYIFGKLKILLDWIKNDV